MTYFDETYVKSPLDRSDPHVRVHPCGCIDRFLAYPQYGWNHADRCEQHKEAR